MRPGSKPWSAADKAYLREHYGKAPTSEVAQHLGRTPAQVRQAAKRFCDLVPHNCLDDYEARLKALRGEGKTQVEIAEALGLPLRTVEYWCSRLSLDAEAARRARIVLANLGIVYHLLFKLFPRRNTDPAVRLYGELDDVVQDVFLHLLQNAHKWDKKRGKFSTWLKYAIYTALRSMRTGRLVRLPAYLAESRGYAGKKRKVERLNWISAQAIPDHRSLVPHDLSLWEEE